MRRSFSDEQIQEIRRHYDLYTTNPKLGSSAYKLAKIYNTSYTTMYMICNRLSYREVQQYNRSTDEMPDIAHILEVMSKGK